MSGFLSGLGKAAAQGASELAANSEAFVRRRKLDAVCTDEDKVAPGARELETPKKTARDSPSRADPTSTRATPPPRLTHPSFRPSFAVYLLDELVSAMRSMPTDHVDDSAEHLSRRVDHRSPVVKLKALRAIKYICERGDSRFRRAMTRHSGAIRSCVNHTGPPDPLKGDAPHRAVREMASQAVAAVFSDGASSDATGRPAAASLSSDSSAFASARAAPAAAPIIGDASDGAPRLNKTTGTWGGADRRPDPPPSRTERAERAERADLGFASRETRDTRAAPSPPPLSPPPLSPPSPTQARLSAATAAPFVLAGSEEQRRVDEACGRGGVKLAPPADVLDAFARACDGLNADGLARALANKIRGAIAPGGTWQDGYKAACCVEAAVDAGGAGGARLARAFADDADAMRALRDAADPETCSNAKLREKATAAVEAVRRRVAGATGGASASAAGGSIEAKAPSPVVTNAPAGDLLGGLGATPGGLDDLLGDLSVGGGMRVPSSPPRGPAMTGGGFSPPPQQRAMMQQQQHAQMMMQMQQMQQMQMQQQMMGMGPLGNGMPGMGMPVMGMGMGASGMGMGMGPSGMGMGMGASGIGMGMGASGTAPGMGIATSPPSSPKMGTHASAGKAPGSPNAIGGGASAYTQHKDSKAFDFVQDMLSGKK